MVGLNRSAARYEMIRLGNLHIEVFQYSAPADTTRFDRACATMESPICASIATMCSRMTNGSRRWG